MGASHGGLVALGFTIAMTALATLFVALRFWARKMTRFGLWWDDWLTVATLVCLYAVLILSGYAVYEGGIGKPIEQALAEQPNAIDKVLKFLFGFEFAYMFASPLMKLNVLAYYWRMFPNRRIKLGIWILTAVCGAWFVGVLVGNMVQCVPISHFWNLAGDGYCRFPASMYYVVVAIPNMVIDLLTVLLPIWEIWHLKLSFWRRVGVCAIFVLGGIVVVASIVRLALLVEFDRKGTANLTHDLLLPWFSTVVEIGVAIIGSCLPCLLPLYRKFRYGSPESRPTNGYGSRSGSKGIILPSHKGPHSKIMSSNGGKNGGGGGGGGPFARLARVDTTASKEELFAGGGQPGAHNYHAKASVSHVVRSQPSDSDSDIPLEGINVHREITVQTSGHRKDTWLDVHTP